MSVHQITLSDTIYELARRRTVVLGVSVDDYVEQLVLRETKPIQQKCFGESGLLGLAADSNLSTEKFMAAKQSENISFYWIR